MIFEHNNKHQKIGILSNMTYEDNAKQSGEFLSNEYIYLEAIKSFDISTELEPQNADA
jgi:hypothetical protein